MDGIKSTTSVTTGAANAGRTSQPLQTICGPNRKKQHTNTNNHVAARPGRVRTQSHPANYCCDTAVHFGRDRKCRNAVFDSGTGGRCEPCHVSQRGGVRTQPHLRLPLPSRTDSHFSVVFCAHCLRTLMTCSLPPSLPLPVSLSLSVLGWWKKSREVHAVHAGIGQVDAVRAAAAVAVAVAVAVAAAVAAVAAVDAVAAVQVDGE